MSESGHVGRSILMAGAAITLAILVGAERIRGALVNAAPHAAVSAETSQRVASPVAANLSTRPPDELSPAASDDMKLRLRDQAQAQLALHQPKYAEACGKVERKNMLEPAFSNYRVTIQFDANGRELSRTFTGGPPHAARDHCVSQFQDEPLVLEARGVAVSLDLSLPVP